MQIEVKGRNLPVTEELRECVDAALREGVEAGQPARRPGGGAVGGAQPGEPDRHVAEATLHLKGITLRAREALA